MFKIYFRILKAVRDTAIDLSKNAKEDPALRGEKDPKAGFHIDIPNRPVGPSTTQVVKIIKIQKILARLFVYQGKQIKLKC